MKKKSREGVRKLQEASRSTVKPQLTITPDLRPPITTPQLIVSFRTFISKMTSEQRPPVNNGHNFWIPGVVVVDKSDCTIKLGFKEQLRTGHFVR